MSAPQAPQEAASALLWSVWHASSGRCVGFTDDPWAADQFQRGGYIVIQEKE